MNQKADRKRKIKHVLKWLTGILIGLSFLLILFVHIFLDQIIKNRIINGVHKASGGLYILEINKLNAEFWTGAISMDEVWLRPDPQTLKGLREKDPQANIPDVNFHFDSVNISSIKWFKYLLSTKRLEIGKVVIFKPDFVIRGTIGKNESIRAGSKSFLELLPGIIAAFTGSLRIESISLRDGFLHHDVVFRWGTVHQFADNINVDLNTIRIDTLSTKNALYSEEAYIDFSNYKLHTPDNLHVLSIGRVQGRVHDSLLTVSDIYYSQKDSVKEKYEDKITIAIEVVTGRGVNFSRLLNDKKISLRTMKLDRPKVDLISSENPVKKYADDTPKKSAEVSILDEIAPYISGTFLLDSLSIHNGSVRYKIVNEDKNISQSAHSVYLDFSRVLLDTSKRDSKLYAEDVNVSLKDYRLQKNGSTSLKIASMKASLKDSLLSLKNIAFESKEKDVYTFSSSSVKGIGINYIKMFDSRSLDLSSLVVDSPDIHIKAEEDTAKTQPVKYEQPQNFFQEVLGPLADARLRAGRMVVRNGRISHFVKTKGNLIEQKVDSFSIVIDSVRVDSVSAKKYDFYDDFLFQAHGYELKVHDDNFRIDVGKISAFSQEEFLRMDDVGITQICSFGKLQRHYFIDSIHHAIAHKFDFKRFLISQEVHAHDLHINSMNLCIALDGNKPLRPDYVSSVPQEWVRKIPFYLRLDTVKINNSYIGYVSDEPEVKNAGKLTFENLYATTYNFTNDSLLMTDTTPAQIEGKMCLMGEGLMTFKIRIPLLSSEFNTTYSGTIDSMEGHHFNNLLAFAGLKVQEGVILPSEFDVTVNAGKADGTLKFIYDDLDIQVIDPMTEDVSKFKSVAGNFIVKNANPKDDDDDPEMVALKGERLADDSFFYFVWKVVRDGIIKTVTKDTLYDLTTKQ